MRKRDVTLNIAVWVPIALALCRLMEVYFG